jgi:hypothetical protein
VPAEGTNRLSSAKLNRMGTGAVINPAFISGKPPVATVSSADQLLVLKADGTYARVSATAVGGGGTGGGITVTWGETPTGAINGTNKVYTTSSAYVAGSLSVYLNGVRQGRTNDYTETTGTTFTFINAPLVGDSLTVDYQH